MWFQTVDLNWIKHLKGALNMQWWRWRALICVLRICLFGWCAGNRHVLRVIAQTLVIKSHVFKHYMSWYYLISILISKLPGSLWLEISKYISMCPKYVHHTIDCLPQQLMLTIFHMQTFKYARGLSPEGDLKINELCASLIIYNASQGKYVTLLRELYTLRDFQMANLLLHHAGIDRIFLLCTSTLVYLTWKNCL